MGLGPGATSSRAKNLAIESAWDTLPSLISRGHLVRVGARARVKVRVRVRVRVSPSLPHLARAPELVVPRAVEYMFELGAKHLERLLELL